MRSTVDRWPRSRSLDTDITTLDVDAIANAANTRLMHGGGVAGAISRAGGAAIQDESDAKAPIGLGEAVETSAGDMPCALGDPRRHDGARRPDERRHHPPRHRRHARQGGRARRAAAWRWSRSAPASAASRSPRRRAIEVEEVRRHLDGGLGARARRVRRPRRRRRARRSRPRSLERPAAPSSTRSAAPALRRPPPPACATSCSTRAAPRRGRARQAALGLRRARSRSRSPPATACCSPPRRVAPALRVDPELAAERAWLLVAAVIATLVDLAEPASPADDLAAQGRRRRRLPRCSRSPAAPARPTSTSSRRSRSRTTRRASTGCAPAPSRSRRGC